MGDFGERVAGPRGAAMCEPDRFFSYRRDGKDGGVHTAFIGLV